jgi:hypothetical protein
MPSISSEEEIDMTDFDDFDADVEAENLADLEAEDAAELEARLAALERDGGIEAAFRAAVREELGDC